MAPKKVVEVAPVLVPPSQPPRLFNNHALIHSLLDILKQSTPPSAVVVSLSVASALQGAELVQYLIQGASSSDNGSDANNIITGGSPATTTTTTNTAFAKKVSVPCMTSVERVAAIVAECLGVTHIYKTDPQACAMEVDVYVDALMLASERGFGSNKASALLKLVHQAKTSIVSTQSVDDAKALFRDFLVFNAGAAASEERAVALFNSVVLPFRDAFKHVGHLHSIKAGLMPTPADNNNPNTIASPTAINPTSSVTGTAPSSGASTTTTTGSSISGGGVQVIPRGRFAASAAGAALFAKGMGQNTIVGGKPMASFAIKNSMRVGSDADVAETATPSSDNRDATVAAAAASAAGTTSASAMKIDVPSVVAARGGKSHPATGGGGLSPRDATGGGTATNKKSTGKSSGAKGGDAGSQPEGFALAVQAAVLAFGGGGVERELSQTDIEGLNPLELAAFIPVMSKGAFTVELFLKIASAFKMPPDPSQVATTNTTTTASSPDDAPTASASAGSNKTTLPQSLSAIALAYPAAAQVSSIVEYAHTTATNLLLEIEMLTVAINSLSAAASMGTSDNVATQQQQQQPNGVGGGVLAATIAIAKSLSRFLQSSSVGVGGSGGGLLGDSTSALVAGNIVTGGASVSSGVISLSPGGGASTGNATTPSTSTAPAATGAAGLFANPAALAAASGFGYYIGTGNLTGSAAVLLDETSLGAIFGDILKSIDNNVTAAQPEATATTTAGAKGGAAKGGNVDNSIAANTQQSRSSHPSSRTHSLQPSARDGGGGAGAGNAYHPLTKSSDTCYAYDLHPSYFDTTVNLLTTVHTVPHIARPDDIPNTNTNKAPTPIATSTTNGRSTAAVADHSISPDMLNHPQDAVVVTEVLQCLPAALSAQSVPYLTSIGHGGLRYFSLDELGVVGRHVMQGLLQPWRLFALVGQFGREELFVAVEEGPGVEPVRYVMTDEQEHPLLRTTTNNASHHHHHNNRSPYARARQNRRVSNQNDNADEEDANEETMELVPTSATTAPSMPPVSSVPLTNIPPSREPCSIVFTLALQTPLPSHPLKDAVTLEQFEKHYASEQALARQELLELQERDRQEREADEKRKEDEAARKKAEEEEQERATLYLEKVEATKTVTRLYDTIESELGDRQGRILKRILALEMALQLESGGGTVPPQQQQPTAKDPLTTFADDM